ncbi:MAG TPA: hypothetical protein VNL91_01995 [Thermoanaerobaculia bacterium]|nr:hypothetical protein [Thermoanaerobaculia bacterium]
MHSIKAAALALAALVAAGCASSSSPGETARPEVTLRQLSAVPDFNVTSASGIPMHFELTITNPLHRVVRLVSVEVESVGQSGAYAMKRVRHAFDVEIAPGARQSIEFRAWVQPLQQDIRGDVNAPVLIRGQARFASDRGVVRSNFVGRGQ